VTLTLEEARRFSFQRRPAPVPGDMRIAWRVSVILLMLHYSRSKKASLAKLHVLNEGIRSEFARAAIQKVIEDRNAVMDWQLSVEPAFGRAINFAIGDELVVWENTVLRAALRLTHKGQTAVKSILEQSDILIEEKLFLGLAAKAITEGAVASFLRNGKI
jgi:hypothetical protein